MCRHSIFPHSAQRHHLLKHQHRGEQRGVATCNRHGDSALAWLPTTTGIAAQTCGTTCTAAGQTAGTYVSVTAETTYNPIFPVMWSSRLLNNFVDFGATVVVGTN